MTNKERAWLNSEIADAQLKLAEADFAEVAEKAYPYAVSGELMPEALRLEVQEALEKLKEARKNREEATRVLNEVRA